MKVFYLDGEMKMDEKKLTHLTENGVHMVEVGDKPDLRRTAIARGRIKLQKDTIKLIEQEN